MLGHPCPITQHCRVHACMAHAVICAEGLGAYGSELKYLRSRTVLPFVLCRYRDRNPGNMKGLRTSYQNRKP